jgi:hypothetical protein
MDAAKDRAAASKERNMAAAMSGTGKEVNEPKKKKKKLQ